MKKLKITIISSILILLINTVSNANSLKNVELPLYTIEKEGKLSHIVGTTHSIPLADIQEKIKEILISQDFLVIEHISVDSSKLLRNESDRDWWNDLSEDEQATLLKLNIDNIQNIKFEIINLQLLHWMAQKIRQGHKKAQKIDDQEKLTGVDQDLINLYADENIFALETTDEVKSFLASSSFSDIKGFKTLLMIIRILAGNDSDMKDYVINRFKGIIQLKTIDNTKEKSYDNVSDDRNLLWIDRIENFHKNLQGKVLFAFGQAHLYSNQGILKLLEDRGFKITKLTFDSDQNNEYLSLWRDLFYLQSE